MYTVHDTIASSWYQYTCTTETSKTKIDPQRKGKWKEYQTCMQLLWIEYSKGKIDKNIQIDKFQSHRKMFNNNGKIHYEWESKMQNANEIRMKKQPDNPDNHKHDRKQCHINDMSES